MARRGRKRRSDTEKVLSGCIMGVFLLIGVLIAGIVKLCKVSKENSQKNKHKK